ncbi:MAG: NAD(P)H-dependent oxidoreductase subunit E, partial [Pseudomonadota bacterium]
MPLGLKSKGEREGRRRGRRVEPQALNEIQALLGNAPRRRDLLIEYLHRIQDRYHCLSAAHIVALAKEMNLPTTEVYEVATFYHHFDVVKEDDAPPPPLTVRVCDSVTCEMFGAHELFMDLQRRSGGHFRVKRAPCVGRCHA